MFDNLKSAIAAEINAKDNSLFLTPHKKTLSAEKQAAFAEKKKAREIQKKFAELDYFELIFGGICPAMIIARRLRRNSKSLTAGKQSYLPWQKNIWRRDHGKTCLLRP